MSKYLRLNEQLLDDAGRKQENLIAAVRSELLVPYCNKHGLRFGAGMGSWSFDKAGRYDQQWYSTSEPPPRIPKTLLDFLSADSGLGRNDLGSLMQSYTPPNWSRR